MSKNYSILPEKSKLSNGLTTVIADFPFTNFIDVVVQIAAGSAYELPSENGITHFLEHMLFRGSKKYNSPYVLNSRIELFSDGLEASTGRETLTLQLKCLPSDLENTVEVLSEVLGNSEFRDTEIESKIILEELLEDKNADGKERNIDNLSRKLIFEDHQYGQSVIGTKENIEIFERADVVHQYRKCINTENMLIGAFGNIEKDDYLKIFDKYFSKIEGGDKQTRTPFDLNSYNPSGEPKVLLVKERDLSQACVQLSFVLEGTKANDQVSHAFLKRVLDDGISSRLHHNLCEKTGLLYDINCELESLSDVSILDISFCANPEKLNKVLEILFFEIQKIREEPLDEVEFEKVSRRYKRDIIGLLENSSHFANLISESMLHNLSTPITVDDWRTKVDEITLENLQKKAWNLFTAKNSSFVIVGEGFKSKKFYSDMMKINLG